MTDTTVTHQVYFWLANPGSGEDLQALLAGVRGLAAVPMVLSLRLRVPAETEARDVVDSSFAVAATMEFATAADQNAYQVHPLHVAFVEACEHLWARVVVYDTREAK